MLKVDETNVVGDSALTTEEKNSCVLQNEMVNAMEAHILNPSEMEALAC